MRSGFRKIGEKGSKLRWFVELQGGRGATPAASWVDRSPHFALAIVGQRSKRRHTMRTSHTNPLQIVAVQAQPGQGQIGITFCPGKKQPLAMTGA